MKKKKPSHGGKTDAQKEKERGMRKHTLFLAAVAFISRQVDFFTMNFNSCEFISLCEYCELIAVSWGFGIKTLHQLGYFLQTLSFTYQAGYEQV